ncbi:hypothetical protein Tco_1562273 [Tanacetum coccineum]|uniref:Uncharacterized protein n=1 Tax=Tanacetum coccineum TaxID=301880 RepID=A0ABQ5GZU6_9ASTR
MVVVEVMVMWQYLHQYGAEWMLFLWSGFGWDTQMDGSNCDGIGGGDVCASGAIHLARCSPAKGGNSEIGGDGDGVVMVRSLSTSASGS